MLLNKGIIITEHLCFVIAKTQISEPVDTQLANFIWNILNYG